MTHTLLLLSMQSATPFYIAGALIGLSAGMVQPTLNAIVMKRAPAERRGAASATYLISTDIGVGVGSVFWGMFIDAGLGFNAVFGGCIICMLLACALSIAWLRERQKP